MHIEQGTNTSLRYFTVVVGPGEVVPDVKYATYAGTLSEIDDVDKSCVARAWVPACLPDGRDAEWRKAAREVLRRAAESKCWRVRQFK